MCVIKSLTDRRFVKGQNVSVCRMNESIVWLCLRGVQCGLLLAHGSVTKGGSM